MEYTTLGDTGMEVSRICLGCMSFGSSDWRPWVLDEEESRPIIERAIELGVNFFDTANMYSEGESERIVGDVLSEYDRGEQVVATKGYFQMDEDDPNSGGLSRKAIEQELDASLERLGMETVDLYQTHRWDYDTPIDQTLAALDDAVRRGKARYIGTSSQWARQFAEALHTSDLLGYERFVTMQNHYNLVYREEEREMLPLCQREGVGVMPWSPLARGYLARPPTRRSRRRSAATARSTSHNTPTRRAAAPRSTSASRNSPRRRTWRWPKSRSRGSSTRVGRRPHRRDHERRTPRGRRRGPGHRPLGLRHRLPRGALPAGPRLRARLSKMATRTGRSLGGRKSHRDAVRAVGWWNPAATRSSSNPSRVR